MLYQACSLAYRIPRAVLFAVLFSPLIVVIGAVNLARLALASVL